jgi:hypothetical protein
MFTKRISKTTFFLGLFTALVFLSGCTANLQVSNQAEDIAAAAHEITDYDLPEGYSEQFSVRVNEYLLVSLTGKTESNHIYLVQAPENSKVDPDQLESQINSADQTKRQRIQKVKVVDQKPVAIRGQQTTLVISEGVNGEETPYRTASALFTGKHGPALVNISAPTAQWDSTLVDTFLASLE